MGHLQTGISYFGDDAFHINFSVTAKGFLILCILYISFLFLLLFLLTSDFPVLYVYCRIVESCPLEANIVPGDATSMTADASTLGQGVPGVQFKPLNKKQEN